MYTILVKLILITALLAILIQDVKERQAYWFLFPVVGLCAGTLFYMETLPGLFYMAVLINLIFVALLLGVIFLYSKFILKVSFSKVIGLGDVLFFLVIIFTCASISFMVLLSSALIFSLILHLLFRDNKTATVPLAGYMSLFFAITYFGFWFGLIDTLYKV